MGWLTVTRVYVRAYRNRYTQRCTQRSIQNLLLTQDRIPTQALHPEILPGCNRLRIPARQHKRVHQDENRPIRR